MRQSLFLLFLCVFIAHAEAFWFGGNKLNLIYSPSSSESSQTGGRDILSSSTDAVNATNVTASEVVNATTTTTTTTTTSTTSTTSTSESPAADFDSLIEKVVERAENFAHLAESALEKHAERSGNGPIEIKETFVYLDSENATETSTATFVFTSSSDLNVSDTATLPNVTVVSDVIDIREQQTAGLDKTIAQIEAVIFQFLASPDSSFFYYNATSADGYVEPLWHVEPLSLTTEARVFYIHNFLTHKECDHLINRAKPSLRRSTVVDNDNPGGGTIHSVRTSQGTFLGRRSDRVMSKINERLARITHVPIQHQEDMQILRYEPGQHYLPHTDFFSGQVEKSEANGLQRLATVLIGLNAYGESYDGGETTMPMLPEGEHQKVWKNVTECTRGMLAVRFKKGDALLFYSLSPDGQERVESTHGSCDVISGTKYSAPIWIRQRPFHIESLPPDVPTVCADKKSACADWASKGECDKNPSFMRNECPKSCDACL